jgi:hypothetical protein
MPNKKEENDLKMIIWVDIDFSCVKRRIQRINNQIETVLFKYEPQLAGDFFSKSGSQKDNS